MKVEPLAALACTILHESFQRISAEEISEFLKGLCREHGLKGEVKPSSMSDENHFEFLIDDGPVISITQHDERLPLAGMTHTLDNPLMQPFFPNREEALNAHTCGTHIDIRKSVFPPELVGKAQELAPGLDLAFSDSREIVPASSMLAELALFIIGKRQASAVYWNTSQWWLSPDAFAHLAREGGPVALNSPAFPFAAGAGDDKASELIIPSARHLIGKPLSIDIVSRKIPPAWYLSHATSFIAYCLEKDMLVPHGDTVSVEGDANLFRVEYRTHSAQGDFERVALKLLKAPDFDFEADENEDEDDDGQRTAPRMSETDADNASADGPDAAATPPKQEEANGFGKRGAGSLRKPEGQAETRPETEPEASKEVQRQVDGQAVEQDAVQPVAAHDMPSGSQAADEQGDAGSGPSAAFDIVADMRRQLRAERGGQESEIRNDSFAKEVDTTAEGKALPFGRLAGLLDRKQCATGADASKSMDMADDVPANAAADLEKLVPQARAGKEGKGSSGALSGMRKGLLALGLVPLGVILLQSGLMNKSSEEPPATVQEQQAGQHASRQAAVDAAQQAEPRKASTAPREEQSASARTYEFSKDDKEMEAARQRARDTLGVFWKAWRKEPNRRYRARNFSLKVGIRHDKGVEHIWVLDVARLRDGRIAGIIGNEPVHVKNLRMGQRYVFGEEDISDWGYRSRRDGKLRGHFTTRVIVGRSEGTEVAEVKKMLAYKP